MSDSVLLRNLAGWWPPQRESASSIQRLNAAVMQAAQGLRSLTDSGVAAEFHRRVLGLKTGPAAASDLQHLPAVLACTAAACRRCIGLWPHPVQFAGVWALLRGQLAEMQTGEGKTLVAAIAATAMAGAGTSVHVISTNDYLARRDCEEMSPIFGFFGLAAGFVVGGMSPDDRRNAYAQAICYASGKELVFDYLKDRLAGHGVLPVRVAQLHALVADAQLPRPAPADPGAALCHC